MNTPEHFTVREEIIIAEPSGHQLYVKRKYRPGSAGRAEFRTLLLVHGATYPSSSTFDLALPSQPSWVDDLAEAGFDVYFVDLAGYGRSGELPEMSQPAENAAPLLPTSEAVTDIGCVVDYILAVNQIDQLCLIGWSWGATISASYASQHPAKVAKLVLHAPQWLRDIPLPNLKGLGAYREVSSAAGLERWLSAIPDGQRDEIVPQAWRDVWISANFTYSKNAGEVSVIRAPNGVLQDSAEYWANQRPIFDPAAIRTPTLIIVGEWDRDTPLSMSLALFNELINSKNKRLVCVGKGTHMLMLEKERAVLFEETRLFISHEI